MRYLCRASCLSVILILLASCCAAATPAPLKAVDISGLWEGEVSFQGVALRLVFHFDADDKGVITATLDSPDQGAKGIPVKEVTISGDSIYVDIAVAAASYSALFDENEEVFNGTWKQSGVELPVTLRRTDSAEGPRRPQDPEKPYPYKEEQVTFEDRDAAVTLAGTITIPEGDGPFPAVVLVSGSGPQNRDEEIMNHRPFLVIADYLTRRGIEVLRYDDRGVGSSTGDFKAATTADFTSDAIAALDFLRDRPETDPDKTGILGHSEGGLIGPAAADKSGRAAFVIMLAGPGMRGDDLLLLQTRLVLEASGFADTLVSKMVEQKRKEHEILKSEKDDAAARKMLLAMAPEIRNTFTPEEIAATSPGGKTVEQNLAERADIYLSPWFRYFMSYDPVPALEKLRCPVLALFGGKDLQVPAEQNKKLVEEALERGGNSDYTVLEFPGLNHLFQHCETGSPAEYSKIDETISPEVLEKISAWILDTTR